jgi:hypothetical protein
MKIDQLRGLRVAHMDRVLDRLTEQERRGVPQWLRLLDTPPRRAAPTGR